MPQTKAERLEFTVGQTEPVTFKLYQSGRSVVSLTGATVELVLWSTDDDDDEWDFDSAYADTTISSDEISWTPTGVTEAGTYYAQLKITWAGGTIEYFPKDFHDWDAIAYPKVTD